MLLEDRWVFTEGGVGGSGGQRERDGEREGGGGEGREGEGGRKRERRRDTGRERRNNVDASLCQTESYRWRGGAACRYAAAAPRFFLQFPENTQINEQIGFVCL